LFENLLAESGLKGNIDLDNAGIIQKFTDAGLQLEVMDDTLVARNPTTRVSRRAATVLADMAKSGAIKIADNRKLAGEIRQHVIHNDPELDAKVSKRQRDSQEIPLSFSREVDGNEQVNAWMKALNNANEFGARLRRGKDDFQRGTTPDESNGIKRTMLASPEAAQQALDSWNSWGNGQLGGQQKRAAFVEKFGADIVSRLIRVATGRV